MINKEPRWINEIPGIKDNGEIKKLTKRQRKKVKEFRNTINNNKIDEWLNKDKTKSLDK